MKRRLFQISWIFLVLHGHVVSSIKCHLTGFPFPKECDKRIAENYKTDAACLTAVVLDEHQNAMVYRQCSKYGSEASELPGGCELLRRKRVVRDCSLCPTDYCNRPEDYSEGSRPQQPFSMVIFSLVAVSSAHLFL